MKPVCMVIGAGAGIIEKAVFVFDIQKIESGLNVEFHE